MNEAQNIQRLIRAMSLFILVPSFTIGLALAMYDFEAHWMHGGSFLLLSAASVVAFVMAPKLGKRFAGQVNQDAA